MAVQSGAGASRANLRFEPADGRRTRADQQEGDDGIA